jgi:hypothetical protein
MDDLADWEHRTLRTYFFDKSIIEFSDSSWREKLWNEIVKIKGCPKMTLFISHDHSGRKVVTLSAGLLKDTFNLGEGQIRCSSVPEYGLSAGDIPDDLLRREIYEAKLLVGVLTKHSLQSMYVMFELGARWGAGQRVITVLAGGRTANDLRQPLNLFTPLSLDYPEQIRRLLLDIARDLNHNLSHAEIKDSGMKIDESVKESRRAAQEAENAPAAQEEESLERSE